MTVKTKTALWECSDGESQWISCQDCAYKFLVDLFENKVIAKLPVRGENFRDDVSGIDISQDFFGEHSESDDLICFICEIGLGE